MENTRFTNTGSVSASVRAGSPSPLRGIPPLSISTISERASNLKDYLTASTSGSSGPSPPRLYGHAKSVPSSSVSAIIVSLASSIFSSGRPKLISEIPITEKYTHSWQDMQRFRGTRQKLDKSNYDKPSLCPEDFTFGLGFECFGQYYYRDRGGS